MRLTSSEWEAYCEKSEAMRKRGVQVGDILTCDEGAQPKRHSHTDRLHVRISEHAIIDGTGPRFFIHGYQRGLVAYVPSVAAIQPGTKFQVITKFDSSVVLQQVKL